MVGMDRHQVKLYISCSSMLSQLGPADWCFLNVVLFASQVQEPDLIGVSHLLVDEIHERGMNEDFLIIILRDLLPRRPDVRLVLMSATINAELFSKYFGDAPVMHILGFTFPVAELFLEDVLEKTCYRINSERDNFAGSSRRKRFSSVKSDPLSDVFEDIDITKEYGNYSSSTRQSLEAWSAAELDLSLVSTLNFLYN
ncbi:hypothetical protein ZEAMMB73_Zm00001d030189 [Zea mays]|uniref:Helicase ATP-binding domain-containing protein n=1 Tax=Zea mays TaxID=4577 RepID=A0A1D6KAV7_MAIZE|nr:hypothetical protein ZEAMMB73_Zm00001d030189 [Zea mays]